MFIIQSIMHNLFIFGQYLPNISIFRCYLVNFIVFCTVYFIFSKANPLTTIQTRLFQIDYQDVNFFLQLSKNMRGTILTNK